MSESYGFTIIRGDGYLGHFHVSNMGHLHTNKPPMHLVSVLVPMSVCAKLWISSTAFSFPKGN